MPSTKGARARIANLIAHANPDLHFPREAGRATPNTLTADGHTIRSYALPIFLRLVEQRDGQWRTHVDRVLVYDLKNSPTTNRHGRALREVLAANGWAPTQETRGAYRVWVQAGKPR